MDEGVQQQDAGQPRQLTVHWDGTLVILSYVISFLGAYASSQVCCQSSLASKKSRAFLAWNLLAAILFGLCSVWSLHFLAMLAAQFEVDVSLDPGVTAFSAFIAVFFTWLALVSDSVTARFIRRKRRKSRTKALTDKSKRASSVSSIATARPSDVTNGSLPSSSDESTPLSSAVRALRSSIEGAEAESQPLLHPSASSHTDEVDENEIAIVDDDEEEEDVEEMPAPALTQHKKNLNEVSHLMKLAHDDARLSIETTDSQPSTPRIGSRAHSFADRHQIQINTHNVHEASTPRTPIETEHVGPSSRSSSRRPSFPFFSRKWSSGNNTARLSNGTSTTDHTNTNTNTSSGSGDKGAHGSGSPTSEGDHSATTPSSSGSFVRSLPLTRRERSRLRSGAGMATSSVQELFLTLYGDLSAEAIAKALVWAVAICAMHYSGMSAFHLAEGFKEWNLWLVCLSYVIAFIVCLVGILFMPNMEVHIGRQVAFSFLAASGVFAMHYTGMVACTFYSSAPPSAKPGYPAALGYFIIAFAIVTCLVSTMVVSHAATLSRNKLLEMIHVKQQLWRTLAQKEAVEATVALQTEFTSVAAHELRTPLYTITGYIDLLSRTQMDEEQAMYIETVRRACHTIQLITTNVLDFTRLERANDEDHARPVLLEVRNFIYNLAEITEDRGPRPDTENEGLELIVDIADNVPEAVYLDETYLTRVIMNLLNNAMKFCTSGYLRIGAERDGKDLRITVTDTGIGIPQRFRDRIFEPFRQADTSLTRVNNGSGLGLAICKRLVARLDGEISVTSVEGQGSTFCVHLKNIASRDNAPSTVTNVPLSPLVRSMMVMTFSQRVQQAVEDAWEARGFRIHPRSTVRADQEKVDFIWTDLPTILRKETGLLDLVKNRNTTGGGEAEYPYVLVVYSAEPELLLLPQSSRLVAVKRPIAIHMLAKMLDLPPSSLPTMAGKDKPKLVRFASMQSSTFSEASEGSTAPTSSGSLVEEATIPTMSSLSSTDKANGVDNGDDLTPIGKKTILLVEDNLINAKLGQRLLATLGYHVLLAYNGLEALDTVKQAHKSIHAILMDCQMPVMSGEDSTKEIRKYEADNNLSKITILALSANVHKDSSNKIMDAGADGFLSKPITLQQLDDTLKHIHPHTEEHT